MQNDFGRKITYRRDEKNNKNTSERYGLGKEEQVRYNLEQHSENEQEREGNNTESSGSEREPLNLEIDNTGKGLTKEQVKFFNRSKVGDTAIHTDTVDILQEGIQEKAAAMDQTVMDHIEEMRKAINDQGIHTYYIFILSSQILKELWAEECQKHLTGHL